MDPFWGDGEEEVAWDMRQKSLRREGKDKY